MPDPKRLKIGDRIEFVSLPEEWQQPDFRVDADDIEFMNLMIARKWPSRICRIDDVYGMPWIDARIREEVGWVWHSWGIREETGWRIVQKRR